jgi:hypothetical protein
MPTLINNDMSNFITLLHVFQNLMMKMRVERYNWRQFRLQMSNIEHNFAESRSGRD